METVTTTKHANSRQTDNTRHIQQTRGIEPDCCPISLYHDHSSFDSEEQYISTSKGDNVMENKKNSLTRTQIFGLASETLYGIISGSVTEEGLAIFDSKLRAFLDENKNTSDALKALDSFIVDLYLNLDPIMNEIAEE